jgi:hypothetical protein
MVTFGQASGPVASAKVRINVNQRVALQDAVEAHKALKRAHPRDPPF